MKRDAAKKAQAFHDAFFARGAPNRFADRADLGHDALDELVAALASTDRGERIDALVMLGRIFASHGPMDHVLRAVVNHARGIREQGIGPERHACMFAMGRSHEAKLLDGFIPVLAAGDAGRAAVAAFVLGYGRWRTALPFLMLAARVGDREVSPAAIWALGQLGDKDALETLLPLLASGTHVEWVLGALGDVGDPVALEALAPFLAHEVVSLKVLAAASMWAILERVTDRKVKRGLLSLEVPLRRAASDDFPPVAAFALLALQALGARIETMQLEALFSRVGAAQEEISANEAFFLARRLAH